MKTLASLAASFAIVATAPASAVTADVAKTCRDEAIKAHPTSVAGAQAGSAELQREAFKACLGRAAKTKSDDNAERGGPAK